MTVIRISLLALACCSAAPAVADDAAPLLTKYCFACHSDRKAQGELNFQKTLTQDAVLASRHAWELALERITQHEMPPEDQPQPSDVEREQLAAWLQTTIERIDAAAPAQPGRVTMRRMNRAEYANTIRDLLGVTFDYAFDPTGEFPADGAGYGFDNIGDVLSISPLHLEKYLIAAEQILDRALIVDGLDGPRTWKFAGDDLRRSIKGGEAVAAAAPLAPGQWTVDLDIRQPGEYRITAVVRSERPTGKPAQMAIQVEGRNPEQFTLNRNNASHKVERKLKLTVRGRQTLAVAYQHEQGKPRFEPADADNGNLVVESLEVSGPLDVSPETLPETHQRLIIARPTAEIPRQQAAEEVLQAFAARAFRRPVAAEEVARYVALFTAADEEGESFEGALRPPLQAILVSPHFLFRIEQDRPAADGICALNSYELASRLSYFLWSSMPDAELMRAAAAGELDSPEGIEKQAARMLDDPKSLALAENFVSQWLQIRAIDRFKPAQKIGNLGTELRNAMLQEPMLVFDEIVRQDRSMLQIIDADWSYLNYALAKHYQIAPLPENEERSGRDAQKTMLRYALADGRRGGVMTMAAVLTVTSHPDRTSPVKRGKWVLDAVLGAPPPPPPANVAELENTVQGAKPATLRQRLEAHRSDAACASCHKRMDPLGFAFENFDVLGRWREKEGNLPIDAAATLPDGTQFDGPAELKKIMLEQKDEFARCLTEKLLTYALGRGAEPFDKRAINEIVAAAIKDDYRLSTVVIEITKSYPFRHRSLTDQ